MKITLLLKSAFIPLLFILVSCDISDDESGAGSCGETIPEASLKRSTSTVEYIESVSFDSDRLVLRGRYPGGSSTIRVTIRNFSHQKGSYSLGSSPRATVSTSEDNISYSTDHTANYDNSWEVTPGGTLTITAINRDCNSISGYFEVEAWGSSSELNRDVKTEASGTFKNIPMDGKTYEIE